MKANFYAVIMAGGGGTRLWPLSVQERPKQMLSLNGKRTLFQMAVDRLEGLFPAERILVVTVAEQASKLQEQVPEIPADNYLLEPMPRGTASVVGYAAAVLAQRDPGAVMAVLTADHFIEEVEHFQAVLRTAKSVAEQGYLVTLGIRPTAPATGYGYIQRGETLGAYGGQEVFRVQRFKEKPDEATARGFLERGDHDWNSGMFIWTVEQILAEIARWMPALSEKLTAIRAAWDTPERGAVLAQIWPTIQPQTVDYGIMEKAERVAVVAGADLGWNDVGSWDSLFEVLEGDEHGNLVVNAQHLGLDTHASLVVGDGSERLLVTVGLEDMILVDSGSALLVCPRSQAQKVREIVKLLKENGYHRYL